MLDAREPKTKDCKVECLFYTSKLSGAAERAANFVLFQVLLTGAEEERKYQTIWVSPLEANATFAELLILHRICINPCTIQIKII
jgi:hypothetical protein